MIITFFGHKDTLQTIQVLLEKVLINLIENQEAILFMWEVKVILI